MFVMAFNDDGKPIVGYSSSLESTHHLRKKNKAVKLTSPNWLGNFFSRQL